MNWTLDYDTKPVFREADILTKQTLVSNRLKDGTSVLMHDRSWTYEVLPYQMLEGFKDKGGWI